MLQTGRLGDSHIVTERVQWQPAEVCVCAGGSVSAHVCAPSHSIFEGLSIPECRGSGQEQLCQNSPPQLFPSENCVALNCLVSEPPADPARLESTLWGCILPVGLLETDATARRYLVSKVAAGYSLSCRAGDWNIGPGRGGGGGRETLSK